MFQRLKGAIDSRIADEQARQRQTTSSPSRSDSRVRRFSSRDTSPAKRSAKPTTRGRQDGDGPGKGPDPAEFEPEFIIGNDELSRSSTPRPPPGQDGTSDDKLSQEAPSERAVEVPDETSHAHTSRPSMELPTDVRVKLRKLEKLESRYHDLLKSYRVAHARIQTIEPFETSLRENTPLTSINDPKALSEYLNQLTLKGDMVLDELKRVSSNRDTWKQKLSEAERNAREAWDEVANLRGEQESLDGFASQGERTIGSARGDVSDDIMSAGGDPLGATNKHPPTSIKSPTTSIPGMSLFSPKAKSMDSSKDRQGSEDLFSYDSEIPRRETELQNKQDQINGLEYEVKSLKGDLAVTRESTQSMVQTLEEATREVNALREAKDRSEDENHEQREPLEKVSIQLREELSAAEEKLQSLQAENHFREDSRIQDLDTRLQESHKELERVRLASEQQSDDASRVTEYQQTIRKLDSELADLRTDSQQSDKKIATLDKLVTTLRAQLEQARAQNEEFSLKMKESASKALVAAHLNKRDIEKKAPLQAENSSNPQHPIGDTQNLGNGLANTQESSAMSKKKNKKKKKAGKSILDHDKIEQTATTQESAEDASHSRDLGDPSTVDLQQELKQMRVLLNEKDAAIDRVHDKLKDQDGLREEIDTLRDDLVNVGQEHVEAKDKVKEMTAEKLALEATVTKLEKELAELQGAHAIHKASSDEKQQNLTSHFGDLKLKATTLQTDLSAAQQLAQSRFKDLNDLRTNLQKAQPEINNLRREAAEVKSAKEALGKRDAEFKRLDSRHEEMRSEVAGLKHAITSRDSEIGNMNQIISQERGNRLKAENVSSKMTQDMQQMDAERPQATQSLDRLSKELARAQEGLASHKTRLRDIEQQFSKCRNESEGLKEEIDLKDAQYASAQSLMSSMRDQTAEMAIQVKEARDRCESLDEEVAEAHRLLGERSREGETMRRLLADVEGRTDAKIREMKERMDTAIDERDRAEDEASTTGRRRARELEDLRNKYRDVERNLKRAEEDKEELELSQRDWKRRREELDYHAGQSAHEIEEVRKAMAELRDALDESERQARELEKQKAELRRSVEETQHRLEKVQKSNKSMADEIGKIQAAKRKSKDTEAQSSRSSLDSSSRISSPAVKSRQHSAALVDAPNGPPPGAKDYTYLKNVLLQFLEQKDKKHQVQLIPVLGMLLHFDGKDEQRWIAAIKIIDEDVSEP